MKHIFKEGQVVYERIRPAQKLIIKRWASNLYYCRSQENTNRRDLVYQERELMPNAYGHK